MTLAHPRRAYIVVDLGFGDAGKGLVTDWLVRRTCARWVVRFNGGAQAGHNVVTEDGRHHTFAQLGSGTFVSGVRTLLSRHVLVHPGALLLEGAAMERHGVAAPLERIAISSMARLVTPHHQAANRLRELARGVAPHGSCGVGFGEAVQDALVHPDDTLTCAELGDAAGLQRKLDRIRERKRAEMLTLWCGVPTEPAARREFAAFERGHINSEFIAEARHLASLGVVVRDETLARIFGSDPHSVVFEGAQGVLLDEDHGFHPHTTWSRCTARNALELIREVMPTVDVTRVGVLRTHMVRHGAGPLPTETDALRGHVSDHNAPHAWQGRVRYGWFDAVLARYAVEANGGIDALVLTHADLVERSPCALHLASGYRIHDGGGLPDVELARRIVDDTISALIVTPVPSLERQERLTVLLRRVEPILERVPEGRFRAAAFARRVSELLARDVDALSFGPRASDVGPLFSRAVQR